MINSKYFETYRQKISSLAKPTKPELLQSFCQDMQIAKDILVTLALQNDTPTLELLFSLTRLDYLIAKHQLPQLVEAFRQAKLAARNRRQLFITQNPDLKAPLDQATPSGLDYDDPIAESVYLPNPPDNKSLNRYHYIRSTALANDPRLNNSTAAQRRFREVYSSYTDTDRSNPKS